MTAATESRRRLGGAAAALLLTLVACGGGGATPAPRSSPPAAVPSAVGATAPGLEQLLAVVNAVRTPVVALGGTLRLRSASGVGWGPQPVELVAARSGALWMRAEGDRGFELASDGAMVRIRTARAGGVDSVPAPDLPDASSPVAARWVAPFALADALLPAIFPGAGDDTDTIAVEVHPAEARLNWLRSGGGKWHVRRRAAVDSSTGAMAWFESFAADGRLAARVEFGPWAGRGSEAHPTALVLRHGSGVVLELDIGSWEPRDRTAPGTFRLRG